MSFLTRLTRLSLNNRKIVAVIALGLVVLGISVAPALKQQIFPDLSLPSVTVIASYRGASPQVVEDQVTKPLEDAIQQIDGLDTVTSTSQQGAATLTASFEYGADLDDQKTAVRNAVAGVTLPSDASTSIFAGSSDDQPTMVLAATSNGSQRALGDALKDEVVPKIEAIDGVNTVTVTGQRDQQVVITPDTDDLRKNGLSASSISSAIADVNGASSAGAITSDGDSLSVDVGGPIASVAQIQNLWLSGSVAASPGAGAGAGAARQGGAPGAAGAGAAPSGAAGGQAAATTTSTPVRLGDVATVKLQDAPQSSITRTDGKPSLGVSVTMTGSGSSSTISTAVRDQLADLQADLPDGAKLTIVSDNGPAVSKSVNGLIEEGLIGLVMAVLVILVFLRSVRSTLVTAISIPLSLLIAIIALWTQDYSLNIFTLAGLTIAVGRVVDDSIVVLENIKRHLGYGEERRAAVLNGVGEVATAVFFSTLTTVSVFIPITLVSGIVGQLFGPFALTVSVAMIASLVVALMVVPVLAYWFLRPAKVAAGVDAEAARRSAEAKEERGFLLRVYRPVLNWALRFRKTVVGLAVLILIGTVALAGGLKTNFLGDSGQNTLTISQTLPVGTALATTNAATAKIEAAIDDVTGVESYQAVVGGSSGPFGGADRSNAASLTVNVSDSADVDAVQSALRARVRGLSDVGVVTVDAGGFGGSSTIDVTVDAGSDAALRTATAQVERAVKGVDSVTDVTSSLSADVPAISVKLKGEDAAKAGVTQSTVSSVVAQAISGSIVSQVTIGGATDDVVLQSAADPKSTADIAALTVTTSAGRQVRLDSVATVSKTENAPLLSRTDGNRASTVSATPVGTDTGGASTAVSTAIAALDLPAGVTTSLGGVTANQNDAFGQLGLAILAALALVVLILLAVFGSFRQVAILLVSVPFAATGAVLLLRLTDQPLGVAALIGVLMLIGIVVTNAIVLMDRINHNRREGMGVRDAVVAGGSRRLRPILMTATATIAALLPMALGITGAGGLISTPLAIVVIGGLFSSTLLTLVLIPVLYLMVEGSRERRAARRAARRNPPTQPDDQGTPTEPEATPVPV